MALYFFPSLFSLTKYLAFNIFSMYLMFLCSIYVQNLQQAVYVFCKFCVLCCLVLFAFIFNIFVTNESMYIVMMIEKKELLKFSSCQHIFHYRKWKRQQNVISWRKYNPWKFYLSTTNQLLAEFILILTVSYNPPPKLAWFIIGI